MGNRSWPALAALSSALAPLVFAPACARESAPPAIADAGYVSAAETREAAPSAVPIVLPDSGPEAIAAAQEAVRELHPQASLRVDLIADLLAPDLFGIAPGAPAEALEKKLGPATDKRGEIWRWPALGVEAVVRGGVLQRLALHASERASDPEMKIFAGEVLVGTSPLTELAPQLVTRQVVQALKAAGARGQAGPEVTELCWRRGQAALYLTFDNRTRALEAIVLEPFSQPLWDSMKPLEKATRLWDFEAPPPEPDPAPASIQFAQVVAGFPLGELGSMRVVAARQDSGKRLFDRLQKQFLAPGESLRQIDGQRAAMLRTGGCTYLLLEHGDGTWEARNADGVCSKTAEPEGLKRLVQAFAK